MNNEQTEHFPGGESLSELCLIGAELRNYLLYPHLYLSSVIQDGFLKKYKYIFVPF